MSPSGAPPGPEPLPVPAPDSHCHLDLVVADPQDPQQVGAVVAAAAAVGVRPLITVGVDVPTSQWAVQAAQRHPGVYAAVAIHPNESHTADEAAWAEIERLAGEPRAVAVGETGLDYYRDTASAAQQRSSFRRHVRIAKATGLALVIHDRDAHDDVLAILEEEGAPTYTVFHCFSGDADFARRCLDRGYLLSFSGTVTFANAPYLREAAAITP
ncbi:MAG: TatD family hydrolase, partial [Mycobacteriales bacterium]